MSVSNSLWQQGYLRSSSIWWQPQSCSPWLHVACSFEFCFSQTGHLTLQMKWFLGQLDNYKNLIPLGSHLLATCLPACLPEVFCSSFKPGICQDWQKKALFLPVIWRWSGILQLFSSLLIAGSEYPERCPTSSQCSSSFTYKFPPRRD